MGTKMWVVLLVLVALCILEESFGEEKKFKKFKHFKNPQWQALHKHEYKDMSSLKTHKYRATHKRNKQETHIKNEILLSKKNLLGNLAEAVENANVSVENHVHSQTTKSNVFPQYKVHSVDSKRSLFSALKGSNLSIENHVHSQSTKSRIHDHARRGLLADALKNANISVENSVHSYSTSKRHFYKKHALANIANALKNANVSVVNSVHSFTVKNHVLRPRKHIDVTAQKRDEEPFDKSGVQLKGKSAMEVAAEIENNDKNFIPMLSSTSTNGLQKDSEDALDEGRSGHHHDREEKEEKPEYVISDKGDSFNDYQGDQKENNSPDDNDKSRHLEHDDKNFDDNPRHSYGNTNNNDDRKNDDYHEREHSNEFNSDENNDEKKPLSHGSSSREPQNFNSNTMQSYNSHHDPSNFDDEVSNHHLHESSRHTERHEANPASNDQEYDGQSSFAKNHDYQNDNHDEEPHHEEKSNAEERHQDYDGQHENYNEERESDRIHEKKHRHQDEEDRDRYSEDREHMGKHEREHESESSRKDDSFSSRSHNNNHYSDDGSNNRNYGSKNRYADDDDLKGYNKHESSCDDKRHGICGDGRDGLLNQQRLDLTTEKDSHLTHEEKMIEFQRNPFDPHDNIQSISKYREEMTNHDAIQPAVPQSVLQIGVDPTINLHYLTKSEHHDLQLDNDEHPGISYHSNEQNGLNTDHPSYSSPSLDQATKPQEIGQHNILHESAHETSNTDGVQYSHAPSHNAPSHVGDSLYSNAPLHDSTSHISNPLYRHAPLPDTANHVGDSLYNPVPLHDVPSNVGDSLYSHAPLQDTSSHVGNSLYNHAPLHSAANHVGDSLYNHSPLHDSSSHIGDSLYSHAPLHDAASHKDESQYNHAAVPPTNDVGNFEHRISRHEVSTGYPNENGGLKAENEPTFPSTPQQPYLPVYSTPQRKLPMFEVAHSHPHESVPMGTQDGARRSTNTLASGQVFEFGDRDYANYLHDHLTEYLKGAAYDYKVMGLQGPDLGIESEIARRKKIENDAQVVLNETEILKQLRDNSSEITILDSLNSKSNSTTSNTTSNNNSLITTDNKNKSTIVSVNNSTVSNIKFAVTGVRKHLIPDKTKLKRLITQTADSLEKDLGKRDYVHKTNKKTTYGTNDKIYNNKNYYILASRESR